MKVWTGFGLMQFLGHARASTHIAPVVSIARTTRKLAGMRLRLASDILTIPAPWNEALSLCVFFKN
jgi:hypothetical protein